MNKTPMIKNRSLPILCSLVLAACTDKEVEHHHGDHHHEVQKPAYQEVAKPESVHAGHAGLGLSSNIRFSNNYDGTTEPAEIESFSLFIDLSHSSGSLQLTLVTSDGLELQSASEHDIPLTGKRIEVPIQLQASASGRYHLKYLASIDGEGVTAAIPAASGMVIEVGASSPANTGTQPSSAITADAISKPDAVVSMPANETIR